MADRTLLELIHGKGAHADVLMSVRGLSADQASRTIPVLPHSIWQIVSHMNFWMRYEFKRVAGTPDPYPKTASLGWPAVSENPDEEQWKREVVDFEGLISRMEKLAGADVETLEKEIAPTHPADRQLDRSIRGLLWQLVAHNSYHVGQVVFLRQAIGSWPPPSGADTW